MASALQPETRQPSGAATTLRCNLVRASTRSSATLVTTAPLQWCKSTTRPAALAAARTAMLARLSPASFWSSTARSST
eukprot:6412898-Alexandrium_andersonii.AAC.1